MTLKLDGTFRIDNLRRCAPEMIETLRRALVAGVTATADIHRTNFYDLEAGDSVFYIHLSPTGTVLLLACWRKQLAHQVNPREAPLSGLAAYS